MILCVLAVYNKPEEQPIPVRLTKPVISWDGWIVQWEGMPPSIINRQNEQRREQGLARGEKPRI